MRKGTSLNSYLGMQTADFRHLALLIDRTYERHLDPCPEALRITSLMPCTRSRPVDPPVGPPQTQHAPFLPRSIQRRRLTSRPGSLPLPRAPSAPSQPLDEPIPAKVSDKAIPPYLVGDLAQSVSRRHSDWLPDWHFQGQSSLRYIVIGLKSLRPLPNRGIGFFPLGRKLDSDD
jgi:hypothetical protein